MPSRLHEGAPRLALGRPAPRKSIEGADMADVDYCDSGGGMIAHTPPGVLTEFGPALREPCGRIHWAGTETSAVMYGFIDGAVRSGERAAAEVIEHEATAVI